MTGACVAIALSACCLVELPVACCTVGVRWWQYQRGEDERRREFAEYARQLSDAAQAYERSQHELAPQVEAQRRRREAYCRDHADDAVGTLGETRHTKGWCP